MRSIRAIQVPFAVAALSVAVQTQAQGMLEEVVVTAAKREQTLQEVPVAVSVVPAETIERAEIRDLLDLQSVVPSLRVSQLQTSTQSNFIIRGFGNGANNPGIEPSVAVFVDGVYRSRSQGRISDLPNIERIEVLRGPQSTLYGKNASAGVISVITSKPDLAETTGNIEAGVGNLDMYNVRGYVTGPISDTVAYSLGGSYFQRDGFAENVLTGTDINNRDRYNLRGELYFTPSDDTDVRVIVDYDELDEICCTVGNAVNGPAGAALAFLAGGAPYDAEDIYTYRMSTNIDPQTVGENWGAQINWTTDFEAFTFSAITAYRDSYAEQVQADVDFSAADVIGNQNIKTDIQTFTQEFRFDGSTESLDWSTGLFFFDESIDYDTGLYFGSQFRDYANFLVGSGDFQAGAATLNGLEGALGLAPGTFFADGTGSNELATQDNQTISVFGQLDFHLTDKLTATVGLAYLEDDKDVSMNQIHTDVFSTLDLDGSDAATALTNIGIATAFPTVFGLPFSPENIALVTSSPAGAAGFQQLTQTVAGAVAGADLSDPAQNPLLGLQALQFVPELVTFPNNVEDGTSSDEKLTYTLRLAYDVNERLNVYTSFATGYKASSWNLSNQSNPSASDLAALLASSNAIPANARSGTRLAGPEESEVFEIGAKYSDGWGYFNVTLFDQVIEGFQSNLFVGNGFALANAGQQSVQGIEIEAMWQATDALRLGFAMTHLDPEYDEFTDGPLGDLSGTQVAGVHEWSVSPSVAYDFTVAGVPGFIQADYQFESEVDIQDGGDSADNLLLESRGYRTRELGLLNASLGFSFANDLELRLWARNLLDEEFLRNNFPSVAQTGSWSGYPSQPRTYGANLRYNF